MKKPILIIVGLCVLGMLGASIEFQNSDAAVELYLRKVESNIGKAFSSIEDELGKPDVEGSGAVVWTYLITKDSKENGELIVGYRQFGEWNGEIGCYGERNFSTGEQVRSLYDQVLEYMGEERHAISPVALTDDPFDFSANHRVSQRQNAMWEVDALLNDLNSAISLFVYDHDKRECHLELLAETKRIEKKLGF